jgi:hypothetical protein
MFTSITGITGTEIERDEQVPTSSTPWVWVGFVFAAAFFFLGIIYFALESLEASPDSRNALNVILILLGFGSLAYWLFCVYRLHKVLAQLTDNRYSISPGEAALKHIIPILGLIWLFQWPAQMSDYLNERGRVKMISGHLVGAMLLLSMLVRIVDGAFGTAMLFGVTMYVSAKLKRHVKTLKSATAAELPPLPDPGIFGQPVENVVSPVQPMAEGQLAE